MGQSVEALLDREAETLVRRQWQALVDARLPSQARHAAESNRPHLTLAYAQGLPPEAEAAIGNLTWEIPTPVQLGGLLVFAGQRHTFTLARAIVPTRDLLALQARLIAVLHHAHGLAQTSIPDAWTPHVTLARRLSVDEVARAVDLLSVRSPGQPARLTAIRRWDGDERREWLVAGEIVLPDAGLSALETADPVGVAPSGG